MNRRSFLRFVGIGLSASVIHPSVLSPRPKRAAFIKGYHDFKFKIESGSLGNAALLQRKLLNLQLHRAGLISSDELLKALDIPKGDSI